MKCLHANTSGGFKALLYIRLSYSSLLVTHGRTFPSPPNISTVAFQNRSCETGPTSFRDTVNIHLLALILVNTVLIFTQGLSLTWLWGQAPRMPCTAVGPKLDNQSLGKESSTLIFSILGTSVTSAKSLCTGCYVFQVSIPQKFLAESPQQGLTQLYTFKYTSPPKSRCYCVFSLSTEDAYTTFYSSINFRPDNALHN